MQQIEIHDIDTEYFSKRVEKESSSLERKTSRAPRNIMTLELFASNALRLAVAQAVIEPDWPKIVRLLELNAKSLRFLLDLARSSDGSVEVDLPGVPSATLERVGPHNLAGTNRWQQAFWTAAICRDADALQTICATSTQTLRDAPGTNSAEYGYLWVDTLRAFQSGDPKTPQLLVEAMRATDPDQIEFGSTEYALDLMVPSMEVLFRLLDDDTDAFNNALYKALERHKAYYGKKRDNRYRKPQGLISIPLTGLCAYAFERDVPIEVESDYIPRELYSGEYL